VFSDLVLLRGLVRSASIVARAWEEGRQQIVEPPPFNTYFIKFGNIQWIYNFRILSRLSFLKKELENHLIHYFECIYSPFFFYKCIIIMYSHYYYLYFSIESYMDLDHKSGS
jgi:hypothetical protein